MNKPVSVILAGASGSGKTTVGRAASRLAGVPFVDGDDLHPPRNVELMAQGTPLTDEERAPWLAAVAQAARENAPCVVACSALTHRYRQWLREAAPGSVIVMLEVPADELRRRLEQRVGHFMKASMLDSQLELREPPVAEPGVIVVDGALSVDELAAQVAAQLIR